MPTITFSIAIHWMICYNNPQKEELNMYTDLPVGTIFAFRYHGAWEYGQVEVCPSKQGETPPEPYAFLMLDGSQLTPEQIKTAIRTVWKDKGTRLQAAR